CREVSTAEISPRRKEFSFPTTSLLGVAMGFVSRRKGGQPAHRASREKLSAARGQPGRLSSSRGVEEAPCRDGAASDRRARAEVPDTSLRPLVTPRYGCPRRWW